MIWVETSASIFCYKGHDKESRTNVNGYEGAGSYLAKVTYEVSTDHVIAIIDQSKFCKQFLRWECKGAVIHNPHQKDSWTTFWTNRSSEFNQYNTPATYFPGAKPGSGNCACGDTGTCTNKSLSCNCDSNDFEWRSDEGFVTYKDDLPILAFRAGDTGELFILSFAELCPQHRINFQIYLVKKKFENGYLIRKIYAFSKNKIMV